MKLLLASLQQQLNLDRINDIANLLFHFLEIQQTQMLKFQQ